MCSFFLICLWNFGFAHLSSLLCLIALQYLNRGCTRFFATKDTDKHIMQNRKSPEVQYAEKSLSSTSLWNLDHRISRKTQFHWNVRLILRYYSNKATYWSFQLYILLLNSVRAALHDSEFRIILFLNLCLKPPVLVLAPPTTTRGPLKPASYWLSPAGVPTDDHIRGCPSRWRLWRS